MPLCAVISCKNSGFTWKSRGGVSYHRFPKKDKVREKWILATGRKNWSPNKVAKICSDHFEERYFRWISGKKRYLQLTSIPTRNVHNIPVTFNSNEEEPVPNEAEPNPNEKDPNPYKEKCNQTSYTEKQSMRHTPQATTSSALDNHRDYDPEKQNEVTSIEIEILPENRAILHSQKNGLPNSNENMNLQKSVDNKKVIEQLRNKILEQDLLIRKLKVRNYGLKRKLFSLKSMEDTESWEFTLN